MFISGFQSQPPSNNQTNQAGKIPFRLQAESAPDSQLAQQVNSALDFYESVLDRLVNRDNGDWDRNRDLGKVSLNVREGDYEYITKFAYQAQQSRKDQPIQEAHMQKGRYYVYLAKDLPPAPYSIDYKTNAAGGVSLSMLDPFSATALNMVLEPNGQASVERLRVSR